MCPTRRAKLHPLPSQHLRGAPACQDTIACFLMGHHAGMALAPSAPPPDLVAVIAQAEVYPTYETAADLERRCAKAGHLRHADDPGIAQHASAIISLAVLLATDARRRPNEDSAQNQLEVTIKRAACLWHCASGGLGNISYVCSPPAGAAISPVPPVPASAP